MLGPALNVKGGVSSVEKLMINNTSLKINHYPTMHDRSLIGRIRNWSFRIISWPFRTFYRRPDLIHIHFSHSLSTWRKLILLRCWKLSKVPVILHSHSSDYMEYFPNLPRILQRWVSKSISMADKLIVLSESWQSFFINEVGIDKNNIVVLMNPINIPNHIMSFDKLSNSILFCGRIGVRKGVFNLLDAWSMLDIELRKKFQLIITGDGEIGRAKSMINDLKISSSVKVLGWINDDELREHMEKSCIYILPSLNEGLPMGLLEAMSYGKSSITTRVGGIPEIISHKENGYLLESGSINDINIGLNEVLNDINLRRLIGKNARKSVKKLSIQNYMKNMEDIWLEVIRN